MAEEILRLEDVLKLTKLSASTIYRYIRKGVFPKPVALGGTSAKQGASGWRASEVEAWMKSRTAKETKK
jgi:prophage regulatory protein